MFKPETEKPYDEEDIALANSFAAFHVVHQAMFDILKDKCPKLLYLTNPVNMKRYPEKTPVEDQVIASWNGNAQHASGKRDVKGFYTIVKPACEAVGIQLEYAEYNTKRIPYAEMPQFYMRSNLAICASLYEGASNSVMEAMASGQALICTDAGNHVEMRDKQLSAYHDTGIVLVPREVGAFVQAIKQLKDYPERVVEMGKINRKSIEEQWSWSVWADGYRGFLKQVIG
jgi:glycosyltransferase involved in cell wall biosynthesis